MSTNSSCLRPADRHLPVLLELERRGPMTVPEIAAAHPEAAWGAGGTNTAAVRAWLSTAITHGWCDMRKDPDTLNRLVYYVTPQWHEWRRNNTGPLDTTGAAGLLPTSESSKSKARYHRCNGAVDRYVPKNAREMGTDRVRAAAEEALHRFRAGGRSRVAIRLEADALARRKTP